MTGWMVRVVTAAVVAVAGVVVGYGVHAGADTGVVLSDLNDAPTNVVSDYLP